jgi:hypothetical protein
MQPIKKVARKFAYAAGGRGDPYTQCESEKRKVARGALLCSQGAARWHAYGGLDFGADVLGVREDADVYVMLFGVA